MVVILEPGEHPHPDCDHGDTCKDRTQAGMVPSVLWEAPVPPPLCPLSPETCVQLSSDVAGRYNLPTFSRRRTWCPSLVLCLCHLLATLLSSCSSITPRHLGWAFAAPGGCGKGGAVLMRPHFQQLWALAGAGGCPPRPCRRCWGGDMLGAALGTSGQVGVRSGRSQVVPAWGCPGCPQAHPSP